MRFFLFFILLFFTKCLTCQNRKVSDGLLFDTSLKYNKDCLDIEILHYYTTGGKYPRSSETLTKEANNFLINKRDSSSGNGYLTFQFTIDCTGHLKKGVYLRQTDEKYHLYMFDSSLVYNLFAYIKTLSNWRIAKDVHGTTFNYKTYMTFKIYNGKVINIIP